MEIKTKKRKSIEEKYTKRISELEHLINEKDSQLRSIINSRSWKILSKIRSIYNSLNNCVVFRIFSKTFKVVRRKTFNFLRIIKFRLINSITPRRKLNKQSKKILYIDHSYHQKTKSTIFFINILKKEFDVEIIWDESWKGKQFTDLSFVDNSYYAVVFFQNLPNIDIYKKINCENIVFVPMFDSGVPSFDYLKKYSRLKIINFSKTLHKILKFWGFNTMYIQRFPKPKKFIQGDLDKIFFQQRYSFLDFNVVKKLLGKKILKVHLHKSTDPGMKFIKPSKKDEKKYQIKYTDWFEKKSDMWNLANKMALLVSPREYEGIGQHFLEAMSYGRAVIAVNNPTMNEYIIHNKNGYLFDLKNPKPLNLNNIRKIQKNAHQYIIKGYKKWLKDRYKILKFIKSS